MSEIDKKHRPSALHPKWWLWYAYCIWKYYSVQSCVCSHNLGIAQSWDCIAQSQNLEIMCQSQDCAANLEIVQNTTAAVSRSQGSGAWSQDCIWKMSSVDQQWEIWEFCAEQYRENGWQTSKTIMQEKGQKITRRLWNKLSLYRAPITFSSGTK